MTSNQPLPTVIRQPAHPAPPRVSFWRPYWSCFSNHPFVAVEVLLILAIVCFRFGSEYGVPNLFWHERGGTQFFAGWAVALLLGELCFVCFLLDAGNPWLRELPDPSRPGGPRFFARLLILIIPGPDTGQEAAPWRKLRWYLAVTWLPLLGACMIPGMFLLAAEGPGLIVPQGYALPLFGRWHLVFVLLHRCPFLLGIVTALVAARFLVQGLRWLHGSVSASPRRLRILPALSGLPEEQQVLHRMASWSFLALLTAYVLLLLCSLLPFGRAFMLWLSPAITICLLLGLVAGAHGFIRFHFPALIPPVLLAIALWVIVVNLLPPSPYRMRFPQLADYYDSLVGLEEYQNEYNKDLQEYDDLVVNRKELPGVAALQAWKEHHPKAPILVVVSVTGGASRSALWTAVVLNRLREELGWDLGQVRLITGASGGMVGAAYLTATLDPKGEHRDQNGNAIPFDRLAANIAEDNLTEVTQTLVLRDLPRQFVPFGFTQEDRGQALEKAWGTSLGGALDVPFKDLAQGEAEGWRPSLVLAPMLVEDGRRLLISNLDLRFMAENYGSFLAGEESPSEPPPSGPLMSRVPRRTVYRDDDPDEPRRAFGTNLRRPQQYSLSAVEFFRMFPKAQDFRLSTAVRMQASFPYVSPAVALPTRPPRRVVDAGYYDNYGVNVAARWIHHHRKWLPGNTRGVLLVQVRDGLSEDRRRHLDLKDQEPAWWERGFQELTGPPAGAFAARESVMSFRNDEQLQEIHDLFNREAGRRRDFFTTVVFERPGKVGMSWCMTSADRASIMQGMDNDDNRHYLAQLKDWWQRRLKP